MARTITARKLRPSTGAEILELRPISGYKRIKRDPMMEAVVAALDASGMTDKQASVRCGVSISCIKNWRAGRTRKPQHITMEFVLRAIGQTMVIAPLNNRK